MKYVVYNRKKKRGQSHNLPGETISTYTEASPGPELEKAIAHAQGAGATLAISEIGRMVSNVHFMGRLLRGVEESGLQFLCCDNPTCNPQTIHILAAVAQEQAIRRSQRTKDVMARLKAEGKPLGSARPNHWKGREHKRGWRQAVPAASKARSEKARREYQWLLPEIKARRERGDTMDEIAKWLNDQGKTTTAGQPFTQGSLWRIIKRYLGEEYLGNNTRRAKYSEVTPETKQQVLEKVVPRIQQLREEGKTYQEVAAQLNEEGYRTPRGTNYSQSVVWNITKKYIGESEGALRV